MSVSPFPFGVRPQKEDASGNPRNGATWTFYDAGTTDLATTWTSSTGATANDNPLSCNSLGQPESSGGTAVDIYGLDGHSYDVVFKDSAGTTIDTYTSIYTVATGNTGVWINPLTATRTGANTFTLVGDQTAIFTVGRKVKLTGNGDRYGYISISAYTTLTTITVRNITDGSAIPVYSTIPTGTDTAYVGIDPAHLSSQPSQIMEVYEEWSIAVASTVTENIVIKGGGHLNITAATTLSGDILVEPGGQLTMSTAASLATGKINNNGTFTISFATTIAADIVNNGDISVGAATTFSGKISCGTGVFSGASNPTFTGSFDAGLYKVFTNTGTITLTSAKVKEVHPVWFGAVVDGATDDYTPLITAINTGKKVKLPAGSIAIGTALAIPTTTNIEGHGRNQSIILTLVDTIHGLNIASNARKVHLQNFSITSNAGIGAANYGITTDSTTGYAECIIENVDINSFKYGIEFDTICWNNKYSKMRIQSCDYAVYTNDTAGNSINNLFEHVYSESSVTGGFRFAACNFATFDSCNFGGDGASPLFQITSTGRAKLINCHFEDVSVTSGEGVVDISGASHVSLDCCSWQGNSGVSGTAYELKVQSSAVVTVNGCVVQAQGANIADVQVRDTAKLIILDNSFTGTINHASGSTATSRVYRSYAPIQARSVPLDLSGAAGDYVIFNTPAGRLGRITRIALLYTEASSADAGITLTIKTADAVFTYATETTEVSKAKWYVKEVTLSTTSLAASDTIIVSNAGGKTGTGEVQVLVEYALDIV